MNSLSHFSSAAQVVWISCVLTLSLGNHSQGGYLV